MGNESESFARVPERITDGLTGDVPQVKTEEVGAILEEFRPYLLAIANSELPRALAGKLAPSDLVQQTITKGFGQFCDFRGTTLGELASWLRRILLNQLNSVKREFGSQKRDLVREQSADSKLIDHRQASPSGAALSLEERELLNSALERLSDDYRAAIALRYSENLSFAEMGLRLNRSEDAARKLWARAVKQLKQELAIDDSQSITASSRS